MSICEQCRGTGRVVGPLEAYLDKNGSFACSLGNVGTCEKCGGTGRTGDSSKPEPMIVTGSVAFALERDALKADNDRLRRELEEARAELARMRPVVKAAVACYDGECDMEHAQRILKYAIRAYRAGAGKEGE